MKTTTTLVLSSLLSVLFFLKQNEGNAQYCDSLVPTFNVNLSASPNMNWISPAITRNGNCCGSTSPDQCLEFVITLNVNAIAVNFNIASGAIPPGALYYQIDCGPLTPVGSPICLYGPGPHHLTFCKPGNNTNTFSITSYSEPIIGPDITLNAACQGFIYGQYYDETTISWTSIGPGAIGSWDYLLSCTSGCDTTYVTAPSVTPPAFVDYLVCGMDVGGCNPNPICDTIRVNFIQPVMVSTSALDSGLCPGHTTTIQASASGGTPPYSYLWNTGATTSSIIVTAGTYSVDVLDASGCLLANDAITVNLYPAPPVNAGPDQIACQGSSITLTATGASIYVWDNGITNGVPFGQPVGSQLYTVIGTDLNGCVAIDNVLVTINPLPIVTAGPSLNVCEGSQVTLNGSGAQNYIWSGGVINGIPFTPGIGSMIYTVTGTDVNGCVNVDNTTVTVNPLPVIQAGLDVTVCDGELVTLQATGAPTLNWDNGITNNTPFQPSLGTTFYTVTGTDMNGCINTDQVSVTAQALPVIYAGPDQVVCEGTSVTLTATGGIIYDWSGAIVNGVAFVPPVGQNYYNVEGVNLFSCWNADTVLVTVNPKPIVDAGPDQTLCQGLPVTLNANGTEAMFWSNGVFNNTPFFQGVGTIEYIVFDILPTSCSNTDTVLVTILPKPEVSTNDVEICEGEPAALTAYGAETYEWENGLTNGQIFYPMYSAIYMVIGYNAAGCSDTAWANVIVNSAPTANFTWTNQELSTDNPGTDFINLSTGGHYYEWEFNDNTPVSNDFQPHHVFPDAEGAGYWVNLTVTSLEGCVDVASQYIQVAQSYSIYVPNAFTPDNNGVNEVFTPVLYGFDEQDFTMLIFNRWGEIVFESHDLNIGWDGSYAGRFDQVQDGTYTWKINARVTKTTERKEFLGHVSVIK